MRRKLVAVLLVMSLALIGGLIYAPGALASPAVKSDVGVRVFRVEDPANILPGGKTALNVGELINGAKSELKRTSDGISIEIKTNGLPEGAYSLWWVIDNDDDDATGGNPGSPLVEGVEIARRATGGIVGANGEGKFNAALAAAPVPPANGATVLINVGSNQVLNPMTARIGIVIRYHGPVIPGAVNEQTTLFAGGCSNSSTLAAVGAFPGGNSCFDPQVTEFHVAP